MKTLVCVDGQENALKAVRLAGKFACTTSREAQEGSAREGHQERALQSSKSPCCKIVPGPD
jgi:hypothetical protein